MRSRLFTTITASLAVVVVAAAAPTVDASATSGFEPPAGYVMLVDETNRLTVAVPDTWDDVDLTPRSVNGVEFPQIVASTDREAFRTSFDVSGIQYTAHPYNDDPEALYESDYTLGSACVDPEPTPYDDGAFAGTSWRDVQCGNDVFAQRHVVIASPASEEFTVAVVIQIAEPDDEDAIDVVLESFNIVAGATWPTTEVPTSQPNATTSTVSTIATTSTVSTIATTSTAPTSTAPTSTAPSTTSVPASTVPAAPRTIVDSTNLLSVTVPGDWIDVLTSPGNHDDGSPRPTLSASPDFDSFLNTWETPGVRMVALPTDITPAAVLANHDFTSSCTREGPDPFNNGRFAGQIQTWSNCPNEARMMQIAAQPADGSFTLFLEVQEHEQLSAATQTVLSTFGVVDGSTYPSAEPPGPPTTVGTVPASLFQGPPAPGAVTIVDDSSNISVAVPADWTDTDGTPSFNDDFSQRPRMFAAPNVDDMMETWYTAGVQIVVYPYTDAAVLLGNLGWADDCTDTGVHSFDNGVYTGYMTTWASCAGTETRIVTLAVSPADQSSTIFIEVQLTDADDTPLRTVLSSVHLL